tara:strand:+ start:153 stop:746 length:594 start_codon:yes stop_codon:yes gene_type:complete
MSRFSRLFAGLSIAGALLVAGCATQVEKPAFPQISFAHLPQIPLDVARIEVENQYVSPAAEPNVEHRFPVSPAQSALNWGRDRLKPAGASGVARVVVERASVVEVPLAPTPGIRGVFTKDQSERYEGVVTVSVQLFDENGASRAVVRSTAQRSQTVPENISLNERDKIWFQMTEAMMATLNKTLEEQVRAHLAPWVR